MDVSEIINIALPIVYTIVGAALIWLLVEVVMTVRKARKTVDEVQKQIEPTLVHVENITAAVEPIVAKVDPLVERVSLTVDAANLEIMRVDQILEDVGEITDSVSSAVNAVDAVASAPMEIVNNVTSRVRNAFQSRRASDESVALGQEKAADARAASALDQTDKDAAKGAADTVSDKDDRAERRRGKHGANISDKQTTTKNEKSAAGMTDVDASSAAASTDAARAYFTYDDVHDAGRADSGIVR